MKYLPLLFLFGCGIHVSVDPILVTHKLDLSALAPYCRDQCSGVTDVQFCTDKCVDDFLATLGVLTRP